MNQTEKKYAINRINEETNKLYKKEYIESYISNKAVIEGIGSGDIKIPTKAQWIENLNKTNNQSMCLIGVTEYKNKINSKSLKDIENNKIFNNKVKNKVKEIQDQIMLGSEKTDVLKWIKELKDIK